MISDKIKKDLLSIQAAIAMEYNAGRKTTYWMDKLLVEQARYLKIIKEAQNEEG
tara:strand:+ start:1665 stop:1826 length:162 start_codon:yes stop_codon:yes gene_type:complete